MASPWLQYSAPRQERTPAGSIFTSGQIALKAATISWSWGLQPAQANVEYVGDQLIATGSALTLNIGGHQFEGVCKSCLPKTSTGGNTKALVFEDYRKFLDADVVFGVFNKVEHVTVGAQRLRRYWHIYPNDYLAGVKSYSLDPLTGMEIIAAMLTAPTTESPWVVYHCDPTSGVKTAGYHPSLINFPSFDIDCENGMKLGSAIQAVLEQHGLVMSVGGAFYQTNTSSGYDLIFARKGEGTIPSVPAISDDRLDGNALSEVPTRVRVVGDRNRYQVHEIAMVPDWATGWEMFLGDDTRFRNYVLANMTTNVPVGAIPTGTRYNSISGDTDFIIGKQLAIARAIEMTVGEFAAYRQAKFGDGAAFTDYRKFAGKTRMLMPAVLYLTSVVFRAFRLPDDFAFSNMYGRTVDQSSVEISSEMLAYVTHDPATGAMFWDFTRAADGSGYAIVQGYSVGQDSFKAVRPERFNLSAWTASQDIWQHIPFQIDDSGSPDGRFILFDEPIIRSADLFVNGSSPVDAELNQVAMLQENPTITHPPVLAALCFNCEKFIATVGIGTKDDVVSVPGLHEEWALDAGGVSNNPYSDGRTALDKATDIANAVLARQYSYRQGGNKRTMVRDGSSNYTNPTQLSGVVDRVTLSWSTAGMVEQVDFTAERTFMGFNPERDFDRGERDKGLYPGQGQLREQAENIRKVAAALQRDPKALKTMAAAYYGEVSEATLATGSAGTIKAGTPVWRKDAVAPSQAGSKTVVHKTTAADSNKLFAGVTAIEGVDAVPGKAIHVVDRGQTFARVKGPISINDSIGKSTDTDATYLKKDGSPAIGQALQSIADTSIKLIPIRIGAGGGGTGQSPTWV